MILTKHYSKQPTAIINLGSFVDVLHTDSCKPAGERQAFATTHPQLAASHAHIDMLHLFHYVPLSWN